MFAKSSNNSYFGGFWNSISQSLYSFSFPSERRTFLNPGLEPSPEIYQLILSHIDMINNYHKCFTHWFNRSFKDKGTISKLFESSSLFINYFDYNGHTELNLN